ncbi:winged helix DNA-binding domain-containing protein [Streptomyces sp. NPDC052023]|uniref:winged helix DNA-binding domain-containing protein n=1 Tax=Streptomyces sp. NPDC052023 TaxID=3365681 RepID=UPI0037D32CC5
MTVKSKGITRELAGARRLERQFLADPAPAATPVADVVAAMRGAHAQVMGAAELSVGIRATGVTRADVRAALWEERSLIKTYGPRGTVHLLDSRELRLWSAALTAVRTGADPFPPGVRLTGEQTGQVLAAIGEALTGVCLTVDELGEAIVARTGPWAGERVMPAFQELWPRWRTVLHLAGQSGAACFGPNRGRRTTYTRPPLCTPLPQEEALRLLVRRHLHAYGPATPRHFAKWLAASPAWAIELFATLAAGGEIEEVVFEGTRAWVAAGDTEFPQGPVRGVRLLPYFDAYGIAAQPRELLFPGRARERALARGQAGNYPLLLIDGVVAGVWHQRRRGRRLTVTVEPLGPLTARRERELAEQAERVAAALEAGAGAELVIGEVTAGAHA